jgi:hypothetical protein
VKKLIFGALAAGALAAAAAPGAWAQVTLGGEAFVGIRIDSPYGEDASVTDTHREHGSPLFNLTATAAGQQHGIRLDLDFRAQGAGGDVGLNGLYAWAAFPAMGSPVRLTMGMINDPVWIARLDPSLDEMFFDALTGARLDWNVPMVPGLNAGLAFRADGAEPQAVLERTVLGARYITADFGAVFVYDLGGNGRMLLGFDYFGIRNLDLGMKMRADFLYTFGHSMFPGTLQLYQRAGYRVTRPLRVFMIMGQRFHGTEEYAGLEFTPGATYALTPQLTGRMSLTVSSADHFNVTDLELRPTLEFSLGGAALIYAEYSLGVSDVFAPDWALRRSTRPSHSVSFGIDIRAF